jgi:mRNA interferase MazF
MKRGEIYYADLSPVKGSEQGGLRPVIIVQNDVGNLHSPTTIVCPITSRMGKTKIPTHLYLNNYMLADGNLSVHGLILAEQVRVIDKHRLSTYMGSLKPERMEDLNRVLKVSLGL